MLYKPLVFFLVGPTAVGKTAFALTLAKKINAEIISLDSMQVYKGTDILSSKPSLAQLKQVPHHLLSIVSPSKDFDVARYRKLALKTIAQIHKKGNIPLFVGGTGLYLSVLVDGIFEDIKKDPKLREKLFLEAQVKGNSFLHERLMSVDKIAASKIHPNDVRRTVRALEVYEAAGKPISELWQKRKGLNSSFNIKIFGLNQDRQILYKNIDARVEKMFAQGIKEEVKKLLSKKISLTCSKAIGINEMKGYFEGKYSLEQVKELIKKNTRNYAKRQLTWFRKDTRIKWLEVDMPAGKESI